MIGCLAGRRRAGFTLRLFGFVDRTEQIIEAGGRIDRIDAPELITQSIEIPLSQQANCYDRLAA